VTDPVTYPTERYYAAIEKLDAAGVAYQQIGRSLYFRDPDGTRLELLRDPLGEMNGKRVL
jgi:catechol 2,3-dioxygenase-like lactoylglutathione lyase family enzyme